MYARPVYVTYRVINSSDDVIPVQKVQSVGEVHQAESVVDVHVPTDRVRR